MTKLLSTKQPDQLAIVHGLLTEAGIETAVQSDSGVETTYGGIPWTAIWLVHDIDFQRATEIVEQAKVARGPRECPTCGYDLRGLPEPRCPECGDPFNRPPKPPDWDCPRCGEHHEGQFSECWKCGVNRPETDVEIEQGPTGYGPAGTAE